MYKKMAEIAYHWEEGEKWATHAQRTNWHSDPFQDCAVKHSGNGNGVGLVDGGGSENNAIKQNLARATLAKQVRNTQIKFL